MRKVSFVFVSIGLVALLAAFGATAHAYDGQATARGVVFHDRNGNGQRDADEPGVEGVAVSNGSAIVETDEQGRYRLPVDDATTLFVIKPAGWMPPTNESNLPQFYYNHAPDGSPDDLKYAGVSPTGPLPERINFPLRRQDEPDAFRVLLFGDPQPYNIHQVRYTTHDVIEPLIGVDAAFGITLGDVVGDDLSLFDNVNESIAQLGMPWYNVIGNHDLNFKAPGDEHADETYTRVYGPRNYAFSYANAHFIMLDNIVYEGDGKGNYHAGLSDRQFRFIKNALSRLPKDRLIVLVMHSAMWNFPDKQRQQLFDLLEDRPYTFSVSGHHHLIRAKFFDERDGWAGAAKHHHLSAATVSGGWWRGMPDERGIPHAISRDGAPNGYSILAIDDTDYEIRFRPASRPADYQMTITTPEVVEADALGQTVVEANVFAANALSRTEMRLDGGPWRSMRFHIGKPKHMRDRVAFERSIHKRLKGNVPWSKIAKAKKTFHLWHAKLPTDLEPGLHRIEVRSTIEHGETVTGRRIFRVAPSGS